jgi:hypothetical protein
MESLRQSEDDGGQQPNSSYEEQQKLYREAIEEYGQEYLHQEHHNGFD